MRFTYGQEVTDGDISYIFLAESWNGRNAYVQKYDEYIHNDSGGIRFLPISTLSAWVVTCG